VITWGDGDPAIPPSLQALHDRAVAMGLPAYRDPATGYLVLTRLRLSEQVGCCGHACRHCPWPAEEQRAAGRQPVRPA